MAERQNRFIEVQQLAVTQFLGFDIPSRATFVCFSSIIDDLRAQPQQSFGSVYARALGECFEGRDKHKSSTCAQESGGKVGNSLRQIPIMKTLMSS